MHGIYPGPGIVPDPQVLQRHGHPGDLVVGRGAATAAAIICRDLASRPVFAAGSSGNGALANGASNWALQVRGLIRSG